MKAETSPPMNNYRDLRRLCLQFADSIGSPVFYGEQEPLIRASRQAFEKSVTVHKCLKVVAEEGYFAGHAENHIRNVAIEAGAIILIESQGSPAVFPDGERLCFLAHVAGVLHDIKRSEPEHARLGAIESERILRQINFSPGERVMIVKAIANHEAFQTHEAIADSRGQLLSDALYDADKFRWGPENFTDTLWDMLALRQGENIPKLFERFPHSMEGIVRIRETFRTSTGRHYGPDFIDRGLEIGRRLYNQYLARQEEAEK
ncbi:MAG: HD family phosphohydrolase [Thermodesulfobacteriota bacterium]